MIKAAGGRFLAARQNIRPFEANLRNALYSGKKYSTFREFAVKGLQQ
jgi:hypothetical protein